MAGIRTRCKMSQLVVAVAVVLTLIQVQSVVSQNCNEVTVGECCRSTTPTCPSGYFRDVRCDVTSTTVPPPPPTTTPSSETDATSTDDNMTSSTTDVDANTTDSAVTAEDNTTESSSVVTPTVPSITPPLGVNCRRCGDNCVSCNVTSCLVCKDGYESGNGSCVKYKTQDKNEFPLGAVVGGAVGGFVLIVVIVVVAVCCCKRRNRSNTTNMEEIIREREDRIKEDEEAPVLQSVSDRPGTSVKSHQDYENLGYKPDDLSTKIQRGQDNVLRYTKDPTFKKPDLEDDVIYTNQFTIDLNEIEQLPEAPAPPPDVQPTEREPEVVEIEDDPQEIYENDPVAVRADVPPLGPEDGEEHEQEVYYNEPETESPYMNYSPSRK